MFFRKIRDEVLMDISMDDPVQMLKEENEKLRLELARLRPHAEAQLSAERPMDRAEQGLRIGFALGVLTMLQHRVSAADPAVMTLKEENEKMTLKEENEKLRVELARAMGRSITLENALKDVFQLIDTEFLIRNTDNDGDPDWAIKMLRPMSILQNAYVAIVGAEPESRSDNGL